MKEEKKTNHSRTLNVRTATIIFAAYFIAQMLLFVLLYAIGGDRFDALEDFLSPIIGLMVMVFVAFVLIPGDLGKTDPTGAAWVFGGWDGAIKGLIIGSFLGLLNALYHRYGVHAYQIDKHQMIEPIKTMIITPGIQQLAAIVTLIVLAPVSEEMMYRGVFYGGYRKSLGSVLAVAITTGIFTAMHFSYYIYAPFNIVPYIVISLVLLWCRLKWNAIGPAIAAHGGYNLVAVVVPSVHRTLQHYHNL